jgi:ketosteroid isomerase-like protein
LQRRDAEAMGACYHDDGVFVDPAFGKLSAPEARAMWRMLMGRAKDFEMTFEVKHADEGSGSGFWEARYTFSKTGRKVVNRITSQFGFHEGLILAHRDQFDMWAWAHRACCWAGRPSCRTRSAPRRGRGWKPSWRRKIRRSLGDILEHGSPIPTPFRHLPGHLPPRG